MTSLRYAKHNIRKTYASATPEQIEQGLAWYRNAYELALTLDPHTPSRAAGVIAALSPITPWDRNAELATLTFEQGEINGGTLTRSIAKANAIMAGADPMDVLTSAKVANFYLSIMGHQDAVCVDRHAFDVARGRKSTDAQRKVLERVGVYEQVADAYRAVAAELDMKPCDLQAVCWVAFRDANLGSRHRRLATS